MQEIGRIVRERRRKLGLTQTELALLSGVSLPFLVAFERGKQTVQLDKVSAVADALGYEIQIGFPK